MKRVLLSLVVVVGVAGIVLGATRAYFTDTAVLGTQSQLSTGTFTISVNNSGEPGEPETFTWDLGKVTLAPGDETKEFSLVMLNDGSIDLGWVGYFTMGGDTDLGDVIYIKEARAEFLRPPGNWEPTDQFILNGTGNVAGPNGHSWNVYYQNLAAASPNEVVTLNAWNADNAMGAGGGVQMGALKADDDYMYRFTFVLAMHPNADNTYMGKTLNLGYTVHATQVNAGALDALFAGEPRLAGPGSNHTTWMNQQIAKQTPQ